MATNRQAEIEKAVDFSVLQDDLSSSVRLQFSRTFARVPGVSGCPAPKNLDEAIRHFALIAQVLQRQFERVQELEDELSKYQTAVQGLRFLIGASKGDQ